MLARGLRFVVRGGYFYKTKTLPIFLFWSLTKHFSEGSSFCSLRGVFLQNEDPTYFFVLESNKKEI